MTQEKLETQLRKLRQAAFNGSEEDQKITHREIIAVKLKLAPLWKAEKLKRDPIWLSAHD